MDNLVTPAWAASIVSRIHLLKIRQSDLAAEAGLSAPYLSTVLSQYKGDAGTRQKVEEALDRLEKKKLLGEL